MVALPDDDKIERAKSKPRIEMDVDQMGDGYVARSPSGLNNVSEEYTITFFAMNAVDSEALFNSLKALAAAATAVQWTPPFESVERDWVVTSVTPTNVGSTHRRITAKLEESFN